MSDFEDFTVTYTVVSGPFGGLSDIGSPGVGGPLVMPEDLYTYMVAAFQAPSSSDYVLGPEYPLICTDIAKILRKQSKPDNHEHVNGIECAKAGECYQGCAQ
ncbi:hypothetical protein Tco_0064012 [Tanacetum coccineum]